jgi:hypothetical protein
MNSNAENSIDDLTQKLVRTSDEINIGKCINKKMIVVKRNTISMNYYYDIPINKVRDGDEQMLWLP